MIDLDEARARVPELPVDDDAAQGIIDEQEAWLARRIGPLEGERTETFYVGFGRTCGTLALRRFTEAVEVTDGDTAVDASRVRLIENGSAIEHVYSALSQLWAGPYVSVVYTPNDSDEVRRVLFELVSLAAVPANAMTGETMGAYSYTRGSASAPSQVRAALASSILPQAPALATLSISRRVDRGADPVINRAEPWT